MGLGKTLEFLALIVGHPARGIRKGNNNTTLIVTPNALVLGNWEREIAKHCEDITAYRFRRGDPPSDGTLDKFEVVLATYPDLRRNASKGHIFLADACDIFKFPFYRIILDECHEIKNHLSQTARQIYRLEAKFRWCCSGTPIPNGARELYSYMKFLRIDKACTRREWNEAYGNRKDGKTKPYNTLVKRILLRRDETTKFFEMPLLSLPAKNILKPIIAVFSDEENYIYSLIKKEYRDMLNENLKGTTDDEKRRRLYNNVTRLRQASTHAFLVECVLRQDFDSAQISRIRRELQKRVKQTELLRGVQDICADLETKIQDPTGTADSKKILRSPKFDIDPQLNMLARVIEKVEKEAEKKCPVCGFKPVSDAVRAECGHTWHLKCIGLFTRLKAQDREPVNCMRCERPVGMWKSVDMAAVAGAQDMEVSVAGNGMTGPSQERGYDYTGFQPSSESDFLDLHDRCSATTPLPLSAKTAALRALIQEWQSSAPNDKIIIFTQWITMGRIIARMVEDEGLDYVYLFGEMDIQKRRHAMEAFRDVPKVKVMVGSLKCGGQSLDLTCASRVVLVDLWWNLDVENQAFARVFRPGQIKETYFAKIMVKDSVDEHIEKIQAAKGEEVGEMLKGQDRTLPKLSIYELASLFGAVQKHGNGEFTIVSDEDRGGEDNEREDEDGSNDGRSTGKDT